MKSISALCDGSECYVWVVWLPQSIFLSLVAVSNNKHDNLADMKMELSENRQINYEHELSWIGHGYTKEQ
jgi:hypothetical protein